MTELIAVNQDPLGIPAVRNYRDVLGSIWSCKVQNGTAVLLFNGALLTRNITLKFSLLNLTGPFEVRDLINQKDLGSFDKEFTASNVQANGVAAILLHSGSDSNEIAVEDFEFQFDEQVKFLE